MRHFGIKTVTEVQNMDTLVAAQGLQRCIAVVLGSTTGPRRGRFAIRQSRRNRQGWSTPAHDRIPPASRRGFPDIFHY